MKIIYRTPTEEELVFLDGYVSQIPEGSIKIIRQVDDEIGYGYLGPLEDGESIGVVAFEQDDKVMYRGLSMKAEGWHNLKQGLYGDNDVTEP